MEKKEVNEFIQHNLIIFFASIFQLFFVTISEGNQIVLSLVTAINVIIGFSIIYKTYRKLKILVSPMTIFSLVWLILIPLTSLEAPLMDPMNEKQWIYCLEGCTFFSIGALIIGQYCKNGKIFGVDGNYQNNWILTKPVYDFCIFTLLLGIALYLIQARVLGGFPIFFNNSNFAKQNFYLFPGAAFLSNIGALSIFIIFCDTKYRKKKLFLLLTIIYLFIQILMTVRFLMFLIIIGVISTYSDHKLTKKQTNLLLLFIIVLLIGFFVITIFRGGLEDKENYFITTNVYRGTARELVNTEIIRYFGMSQRTMEAYIESFEPGVSRMGHTFYPILNSIGIEPYIPVHFGIHGYTACNIIAYFYFDAGNLWWLLMIIWSMIMNGLYFKFRHNPDNIINKYLWGISAIGVAMSFYCYINAYPYWYFHYIIILFIINKINNKQLKKYERIKSI